MEIAEACKREKTFSQKLKIIFGNPELLNQDIRPALEERFLPEKRLAKESHNLKSYLNIQLFAVVSLLFLVTYFFQSLETTDKLFAASFILVTLVNCGALLEQRRWIYYLEIIRVLILAGFFGFLFNTYIILFLAGMFMLFTLIQPVQQWYLKVIYDAE
jgi:asparagine N-glycosylation enzyme membrane subunit Stt3